MLEVRVGRVSWGGVGGPHPSAADLAGASRGMPAVPNSTLGHRHACGRVSVDVRQTLSGSSDMNGVTRVDDSLLRWTCCCVAWRGIQHAVCVVWRSGPAL